MGGDRRDFFVSHAGADRAWAEWVAWQLIDAGYTVELDAWDWSVGQNFMLAMSDALGRCDRVLALLSAAYFDRSRYTTEEWTAALLHGPGRDQGRLVPVRVQNVSVEAMPEVLRPLLFCDLFKLDAPEARRVLLEAVKGPARPDGEPVFPGQGRPGSLRQLGGGGPRLPGSLPRIWNLPAHNPGFTGRDGLLVAVRERLVAEDKAVAQAFEGMGGVGKTQLAIEYAYRFAGAYDLAWWIDAEQAGLIGDQFAALGMALGCVQPERGAEAVRAAVLGELRERDQCLLVFDNAEKPADIIGWLPGAGHVLITSRERAWTEVAASVEVDVLARAESVAILCNRVAGLSEPKADRLAAQLGDLPLGIAQAAGFMAETGSSADQYLELLRTQAGTLLDHLVPGSSYPQSLAAVTGLSVDRLERDDPAAAQLAFLCAFLASEPIPEDLFTRAPGELPGELAAQAADPLAWRQTLGRLARQSLARIDQRGLVMHRLTQAILRDRLTSEQAAATRKCSEAILAVNNPDDPPNPVTWPRWAQLMPHLLAADLAATGSQDLRLMAREACSYLLARGDPHTVQGLATHLRQQWRNRLGDDDENTLSATNYLAWSLRVMGRYTQACELDEDTLARERRLRGEDHPDTLSLASNFALDLSNLGEHQAARELTEDTLARRRRVLGEDHRNTLGSAQNLAIVLSNLGEHQAARELNEDTLARRRRVLGEDHPDTLGSAENLAIVLSDLGEQQAARELTEDTLARRRRVLGEDHPDTLRSAHYLVLELRHLGERPLDANERQEGR